MSNLNPHSGIGNVDRVTVLIYLFLVFFGWLNIYSAAFNPGHPSIFDFDAEYGKQFMWILVSFALSAFILYIEGTFFIKFAGPIYAFFTMLLILVLLIGKEVNGAKAWFGVGSFGIQPSEFSKVGVALFLAKYITDSGEQFKKWKTRIIAAMIIGVPALLILRQPDVGSVLTFVAFILVMYREGLSGNVLIIGLGAIVFGVLSVVSGAGDITLPFVGVQSGVWLLIIVVSVLGILSWILVRNFVVPRNRRPLYWILSISVVASSLFSYSVSYMVDSVLEKHHKERIYVMLSLPVEREDAAYNSEMAKITVGSGGFIGRGYMDGPMTQNNFVPEQWTDFIFSAVAEEWGFVGSALIIALFCYLIIRIITIAERQRSKFSRVFGYCVAMVFFMHLLINVGMVIGLAPIIGIPLPFFSYGGSALMGFSMLLFILLRLDAERLNILR